MAIGYDPYGDNVGNLYQPWPDANTGMNGQPWGQPQPIDRGTQAPYFDPRNPSGGATTWQGAPPGVDGAPAYGNGGITGNWQNWHPPGYDPTNPMASGVNSPGQPGYMGGSLQQPNWQSPNVSPDQVSSYFASRGTTPNGTSPGYWASKWPELYQRGLELGNPNYAFQRLQYADEFLPGGPSTSPFYEAPTHTSISGVTTANPNFASVTPSATAGTVSPTYTAMLNNSSAYGNNKAGSGLQTTMDRNNQGLTLAQLIGMGR